MPERSFEDYQSLIFDNQDDAEKLQEIQDEFVENFNDVEADKDEKKELLKDLQSLIKQLEDSEDSADDDFAFDYDYSKFEIKITPLDSLNEQNQPYPLFLRDVIIPTFHPLPYPDLQNPILATICLINSSAIPPKSPKNPKEVPLSPVYIQGVSGSGKSQITHLISRHYPQNRATSVTGTNTGGDLIQKMTDVCYRSGSLQKGDLKLYPSVIFMENFYNTNLDRWGHFATQLLATERSFATASRQGQDARTFYTFLLKVFTSVQPLQAVREQNVELLRRTIRLFTEPDVPKDSMNKYDWSVCKDEYAKLWQPKNVEEYFFPILKDVVTKHDDETIIKPSNYPPSQLIIAVGVFAGIWESLEEAEYHMSEYWKLVEKMENSSGKPYLQTFQESIDKYWREFKSQQALGASEWEADKIASETYLITDTVLKEATEQHGNFYKKHEMSEALQHFMQSKGFKYTPLRGTHANVFKRFGLNEQS